MKLKKLIAILCALTFVFSSVIGYAEVSSSSLTTETLVGTKTVSCGVLDVAGLYNPIINVTVDTGNGGVVVNVFKNTTALWKQLVPEGETGTIDLTVDVASGEEISFTMTPEIAGKVPAVTYDFTYGDIYNPINTGKAPGGYSYTATNTKTLGDYVAAAEAGNVYAMYNYKRIPMTKSGDSWSVNPLQQYETGTLGDLNDRSAAQVGLSRTLATLGRYGGIPNIDIPITEAGVLKIDGDVPGIKMVGAVYKGVVTNIYKNGKKLWSSRVGDYSSVRYDEGYQNSYFNETIDVATKVKAGDIITFSFDAWLANYDDISFSLDISDVSLSYIDGDILGEAAEWLLANSDVYDAEKGLTYKKGEIQKNDMLAEDGKAYIAADVIEGKSETISESFNYADSGTGLKETYKPFNISTHVGQIKDSSLAFLPGTTKYTAQLIMNADDFAAANNPDSCGVITYEFKCKGSLSGDAVFKIGRVTGDTSWWADGIAGTGVYIDQNFGCRTVGGATVTPTYTYDDGWYRVKIEINVASKTAYISVNDAKTSGLVLKYLDSSSFTVKDCFRLQFRKSMVSPEEFYIDDVKVTYTEDSDFVYSEDLADEVESITKNGKIYYNICDLARANGKNALIQDGRFVVVYDGLATQLAYSELSRIAASACDDAILTEYGTKVDFANLGSRLRINVKLIETATADKETKVILAGYKNGVLVSADMKDYTVLAGQSSVDEFYDIDNALGYDAMSVFVWGTDMVPEADAGSISK